MVTEISEKQGRRPGEAAREAAEDTGKAVQETAERTQAAAGDTTKRAARGASEAAERTSQVVAEMTSTATRAAADSIDPERAASISRDSIEAVIGPQQQAIQVIERASTSMLNGLTEMQREIADFVSERIRQDLETQREMLRCRTFNDLAEVQGRFFQTAMDQCSAQARKLMRHSAQVFEHSIEHRDR